MPLLDLRGITKVFPGVRALDSVDFTLDAGEIHSLMGENGAGKSTLIKVFTGVYAADAGTMLLDGRRIAPRSPAEAQRDGISTVYQEVNLVPELSVSENLFLGRQPRRFGLLNWRKMNRLAREAAEYLGLRIDVTAPLRSYSIAIQQMVAIARAVDTKARVLVLDEPTSSLDKKEVEQLFAIMRRLRDTGMGIVFVSHFLDQIYAISDRITVLRNGKLVGSYTCRDLPRLKLISAMIGKSTEELEQRDAAHCRPPAIETEPLIEAVQLGRRHEVTPSDLVVRRGEIVGLAGLLGSGRTELASLLFGTKRPDSGHVLLKGRRVRVRSPRRALSLRMGMLPEDRRREAILPNLSVRENIVIALQARRGWWWPVLRRRQRALAQKYIASLCIATPDAEKPIGQLSGGNQQKVVLARWLASQPEFLILDEPTRGVDVGAKAEIESLMKSLCAEGMGLLFISAELEELVRDCHRVAVLCDRRKVGELAGEQITLPTILRTIANASEASDA